MSSVWLSTEGSVFDKPNIFSFGILILSPYSPQVPCIFDWQLSIVSCKFRSIQLKITVSIFSNIEKMDGDFKFDHIDKICSNN